MQLAFVPRPTPLAREALLSAAAAAALAAGFAWLGPPGSDLAAHAYQRAIFIQDGFALWNNFWYSGRYSFVTYSLLYYPLAALLGIKLLAVATIATAALAFAVVLGREWGPTARWSSRTFAVVWAGIVLSAAFPFALGIALALLALWTLQAQARWRFAALALLTLAASPVAFLLLALVLTGIGIARIQERRRFVVPALTVAGAGAVQLLLSRAFPADGQFPFSPEELAAACTFCLIGAALTWRVEPARMLRFVFVVYLAACLLSYLVPSAVGENVARLRFAAVPIAVLSLSLRNWRPLGLSLVALGLAISWNVAPLAASFAKAADDPATESSYWQPAVSFLRTHLSPSYRVEAVDTAGHWAAVHLPRAGIPLARGWFRQDDFPQNSVLYSELGPRTYQRWLRGLGIRYVVLTDAPPDYSARAEAELLASARSGLTVVLRTRHLTVFEVPRPRKIVTGPGSARVISLRRTRLELDVPVGGRYRLAVRHSPYWGTSSGCLTAGKDGMLRLDAPRAGRVELVFDVDAGRAIATVAGRSRTNCAG
ncbi:MAG: hypothetical protein H0U03_13575 [Actinobacteria bacterium]|nr:hypothetical protein [Actinomycetota bacterium]